MPHTFAPSLSGLLLAATLLAVAFEAVRYARIIWSQLWTHTSPFIYPRLQTARHGHIPRLVALALVFIVMQHHTVLTT